MRSPGLCQGVSVKPFPHKGLASTKHFGDKQKDEKGDSEV